MNKKEVFWIGDHVTTSLGIGSDYNFKQLVAGQSGIKQHDDLQLAPTPLMLGKIGDDSTENNFDPRYTRLENLIINNLEHLITEHHITTDDQTLVVLSSTKGNINLLHNPAFDGKFPDDRVYLSAMATQIQKHFHLKEPILIVSNACISGSLAISMAHQALQSRYKRAIVIGADEISKFIVSGFNSFHALSDKICRPFDKNRNGLNLGEAVASVYLSLSDSSAIAKVGNWGTYNDANHISGPSRTGEGLFLSIKRALSLQRELPDFISAHGTATPYNDEMESIAMARNQLSGIPTHSLKAYFGHTLGASGLLETIMCVHSLVNNQLIPSLGFEEQGTSERINMIESAVKTPLESFLKLASGFGGCNIAAYFEKTR